MTFLIAILHQSFVPEENSHIVNGKVGMVCIRLLGKKIKDVWYWISCRVIMVIENFLGTSVIRMSESHLDFINLQFVTHYSRRSITNKRGSVVVTKPEVLSLNSSYFDPSPSILLRSYFGVSTLVLGQYFKVHYDRLFSSPWISTSYDRQLTSAV